MVDHRQGGHRSSASGRLAGPPLDEPEADQGGGEQVEPEQDVEPALVADGEPPEAREPGQRALDHPAMPAQALRALDTSAGDAGLDAPRAAGTTAPIVVVPFVGVQLGRMLASLQAQQAESGVKRNIPGRCGNALAVNGNPGWRARWRAAHT
jgi:hypothetical protein